MTDNKQPRPLTEAELSLLQGMRAMTLEEMSIAQRGAQALSEEEIKKREIETTHLLQNLEGAYEALQAELAEEKHQMEIAETNYTSMEIECSEWRAKYIEEKRKDNL